MASKEELKRKVRDAIDQRAEEIVRVSKTILDNPETGFREVKTSRLVRDLFAEAGIDHRGPVGATPDFPLNTGEG